MLLSKERQKTEEAISTMQKEVNTLTDAANDLVKRQEMEWNSAKEHLLKEVPAEESASIDEYVRTKLILAHTIPFDDSKLLRNRLEKQQASSGASATKPVRFFSSDSL